MREKLIQEITQHFVEDGAWKDPRAGAELILAPFRCEKCEHWQLCDSRPGYGECMRVQYPGVSDEYTEPFVVTDTEGWNANLYTKPDFFCALFEQKQPESDRANEV